MDLVRAEVQSNSIVAAGLGPGSAGAVVTTFDLSLQHLLAEAVHSVPDTGGRFAVSAVVVDVVSGAVVAAADTSTESSLARLARPTGSVLKFVVALAAVAAGAQADDLVDGGERCTIPPRDPGADPSSAMSFAGDAAFAPGPLAAVTASSVNCAYAKLYEIVGGQEVTALAGRLGLTGVVDDTPRIVIGSEVASPLEMARAMSVVLGDGVLRSPAVVNAVAGVEIASTTPDIEVAEPSVAGSTADLLTNVVETGTASANALAGGRPAAGKTGTQQGNSDAWFVGGTPEYVVAVWMGNPADPADGMIGVPQFGGVARVQGGAYPASVWKQFLDAALDGSPVSTWPTPTTERGAVRLVLPTIECSDQELLDLALPALPVDAVVGDCG